MDGTSIDWSYAASQAYLPPRSPLLAGGGASSNQDNNNFFSNRPKVPHPGPNQRHQRTPSTSFLPRTPAWVDDLLNDTPDEPPTKGGHRRSSSDSIAFLEAPSQHVRIQDTAEEGELDSGCMETRLFGGSRGLVKLDEEPTSSRYTESGLLQKQQNVHAILSLHHTVPAERKTPLDTSSTPSDHDSANASSLDEKRAWGCGQSKNDSEVQSALKAEHSPIPGGKGETSTVIDAPLDPKRAKRILANRQSAQRSRVRKLQYIAELERTVNVLQEEVSTLSPQVTYLDRHRIILNVDNSAMKQRIAALAQEKLFKDSHNEALKTEVHWLRQLYQLQQQKRAQQQSILTQVGQQQLFDLPTSSQLELKDDDIASGSDVSHCVDNIHKDNDSDLLKGSSTLCTPSFMKPIGPSSCCNMTSDKGKDVHMLNMPGLAQLHSDFRVQNT